MGVIAKTVTGSLAVSAVCIAVNAGAMTGWGEVWERATGWWTPGWGNLFTVAIAAGAIAVSAAFNLATLRRSLSQFRQVRIDATTDKLRNELVEFFTDLEVCRAQTSELGMRLQKLAAVAKSKSASDPEAIEEYRVAAYQAYRDTLPEVHLRLAAHEFKLMLLTTDKTILIGTGEIRKLIVEDKNDFEVIIRADGDPPVTTLKSARGDTLLERHLSRNEDIYKLFVDLGHYCAKTFAMTPTKNKKNDE